MAVVSDPVRSVGVMKIDCDACEVRGPACGDCVVSFLTIPVRAGIDVDEDQVAAIAALSGAGLVPPLRLVRDAS